MNRVFLWLGAAAACGGLLAVAAFGAAPPKGGTLRLSSPRLPDSVDPAIAYSAQDWELEAATCARLYDYPDRAGPAGAVVVPEVASGAPQVSKDGKTQTFQLKRGYHFQTGQPITASNFVASFNRDASPKLNSPATAYLHEIVGADAVMNGTAQTISGVSTLGPYTLQIRTTRPLPDLTARLTMPFFCPIAVDTPPAEITNPLGSGPYYVADYVPNRQVALNRNSYYGGPRPANVDQIVWTVNDPETCRVAVEQNQLDYCAGIGIPAGDVRAVAATYGINRTGGQFFFNAAFSVEYFVFNHDRPAFHGPGQIPLAQAINWAIDRRALVHAAGYLAGKRTAQILPPALTRAAHIYPTGAVTERSLAKARALLRRAKLRPTKLVLYTDTLSFDPAWAQIFQFNLKRIGIDVEIKYFPHDTYPDLIGTRGTPFDVAISGFGLDFADPVSMFAGLDGTNLKPTGNTIDAYFDEPTVNRAIERIESMRGAARRKAWADLDVELMRDDPPLAPVMADARTDFVSRSFGCFLFQPVVARPDLAAACKK